MSLRVLSGDEGRTWFRLDPNNDDELIQIEDELVPFVQIIQMSNTGKLFGEVVK